MALTFSTFCHTLKPNITPRINNKDFVNLLFAAIPVEADHPYIVSKNAADKLIYGRKQIPVEIRFAIQNTDWSVFTSYFQTSVIPRINEAYYGSIMKEMSELAEDDIMVPDSEKEIIAKFAKDNNFPMLLTHSFGAALSTENVNPNMLIHKAPVITPWPEMPDYTSYLKRMRDSYSCLRTLLYYDEPKPFYSFYVCNYLSTQPSLIYSLRDEKILHEFMFTNIKDATIKKLSEISNYVIIMGTGGLGKSMMMRNLLLCSVKNYEEDGMVPVFVPLKDYKISDTELFNYIYNKFTDGGRYSEITSEQFEKTLQHNRVQILLDGYDEIRTDCVEVFEKALKTFMKKYPNNFYIISSRPFDHIASFQRFLLMDLVPFDKSQSLDLIDKLEFRPDEPDIKQRFAKQLNDNLYRTHKEFASNPLLLTIMLMTFEQYAEVPSKMHIFYREAYATLSQKHDASKGAYKRALHTGLSADRFADYFAEFCARTYKDEKYEMTVEEIENYFNQLNIRKNSADATFTVNDFIYDLRHNLCLLYRESGKYHFTHRSFQEYFCALFYSRQKDRALYKIGQSFEKRKEMSNSDKTFHMLYDMIPEKVEEYIFLPVLKELFNTCDKENGYWTYLNKYVGEIYFLPIDRFSFLRGGGDNTTKIYPEENSFLIGFILHNVAGRKKGSTSIQPPYYKEFVIREYDVYKDENGQISILPSGFEPPEEIKKSNVKLRQERDYRFKIEKIVKNKAQYSDLVALFEREDFQTFLDYEVLRQYYNKLRSSIEDKENDALDFL